MTKAPALQTKTSSAKDALIARINDAGGRLSLRDYMGFCLSDPDHGYYSTKQPLGKQGDFITAPEISQVFGELIGLWFVNFWETKGCPENIAILELGPGRGLLMADILRTFKIRPALLDAIEVHQVEINPHLKKDQLTAIDPMPITHHNTVEDALGALEDKVTLLMANEFFDALPIDQYVYQDKTWQKRYMTYNETAGTFEFQDAVFEDTFGNCAFPLKPAEGTIMESAPLVEGLFRDIAKHISCNGGAAIIVDYGYDKFGFGDTFQALKDHDFTDPLENPGDVDLTVHVNFATLLRIAQQQPDMNAVLETQGEFLGSLGIDMRTDAMIETVKDPKIKQGILDATNRLVAEDQMGDLFKALQIWT